MVALDVGDLMGHGAGQPAGVAAIDAEGGAGPKFLKPIECFQIARLDATNVLVEGSNSLIILSDLMEI